MSMPIQLQEECVFKVQDLSSICSQDNRWKQQVNSISNSNSFSNSFSSNNNRCNEPTSVLHMRRSRSQSPPTSASTLSSSLNNSVPQEPASPLLNNESEKDEWATTGLQPIPHGLEVIASGEAERCGLGLEDWETMLSESGQEQSILKWIAGDVDDASFGLKHLLHSGGNGNGHNPLVDFDGNAAGGFGIVDQAPNFESIGGGSGLASGNDIDTSVTNSGGFPDSGLMSTNNGSGKIGYFSGLVNHKVVSGVGLNSCNSNFNLQNEIFGSPGSSSNLSLAPVSLPPGVIFQQSKNFEAPEPEEKPHILSPQLLMNHQQEQSHQNHNQNPNFVLPLGANPQQQEHYHHLHQLLLQSQPKRGVSLDLSPHVLRPQFSDLGHEFLLKNHQQPMGFYQNVQFLPQHHQEENLMAAAKRKVLGPGNEDISRHQHALLDQLYKAAELVEAGNLSHAQVILARLNHHVSPTGKPLQRAMFYFKEALQLLVLMNNPVTSPPQRTPTHFDVIFKMGAYKVFSEVSPFVQFVNFTCNQALLEALHDADRIHIVDFDIGLGAQWASFMQELSLRSNRGSHSLKITAFASPSTHHHVELELIRENLTLFAHEIGVRFQLDVMNFDSLDQTSYALPLLRSSENEAVAINFLTWSSLNQHLTLPCLLRILKQLSPKIMVSADRGCDRSDLPFPEHIRHSLQSHTNLLESLDAVNVTPDALNKIERFLIQPRIESSVFGRFRGSEKLPLGKTLFASAGFSPLQFSNFTETQAECVVKRTPVRGFHVEKRQASLVLCWQRQELISASAWTC